MLRKKCLLGFGATSTSRSRNFYVILSRLSHAIFDNFVIYQSTFGTLCLPIVHKLYIFKAMILSRVGMNLNHRTSREDRLF